MLETLDVRDVSAKRSVDRTAVGANKHTAVDRRPGRIRGATVGAQRQGMPRLGFVEHFYIIL